MHPLYLARRKSNVIDMFYYSPTKGEKQGLAGLQQLNTPPLLQKQKIEGGWAEERAVGVSRPNNRVAQVGDGGGRGGVEWHGKLSWSGCLWWS